MLTMPRCLVLTAISTLAISAPAAALGQSIEGFDRDEVRVADNGSTEPQVLPDLDQVRKLIVEQTNAFRSERELQPLDENDQLDEAAQYFADFMARTGKYGHQADDQRPSQRAAEYGYEYCIVLENIGWVYSSAGIETEEAAERFMTGWKESEGHRRNLLDPDIHDIGVAIARGESGKYYAVQKFGRPEDAQIEFAITNPTDVEVEYRILGAQREDTFVLPPNATATHTRCRPPQLQLVPQEEQPELDPLSVESGDRFQISGEAGGFELRKAEDADAAQ